MGDADDDDDDDDDYEVVHVEVDDGQDEVCGGG
jgi:hypothetical protein